MIQLLFSAPRTSLNGQRTIYHQAALLLYLALMLLLLQRPPLTMWDWFGSGVSNHVQCTITMPNKYNMADTLAKAGGKYRFLNITPREIRLRSKRLGITDCCYLLVWFALLTEPKWEIIVLRHWFLLYFVAINGLNI